MSNNSNSLLEHIKNKKNADNELKNVVKNLKLLKDSKSCKINKFVSDLPILLINDIYIYN